MRALPLGVAAFCVAGLLIALTAGPAGEGPPLPSGGRRTFAVGPTGPLAPGVLLAFYDVQCPHVVLLGTDSFGRGPDGLAALWLDSGSDPGLDMRFSSALLELFQLRPTANPWPRLPGQGTAQGFAMEVHFAPANLDPPSFYIELRGMGYAVDSGVSLPIALSSAYVISESYCV